MYEALISRAKSRTLEGYSERHHVIPKCVGGTDEKANIVRLTAQEHYVAHLLLMKMMPDEPKLVHAAWTMIRRSRFVNGRSGGKAYAWLRVKYAQMMREKMSGHTPTSETKAKRSASAKKNTVSEEQRKRMTAASTATRTTPEFRARISEKLKQQWQDPAFRAAKAASMMNRSSEKRSAAMRNRWKDDSYRSRMQAKLAGMNVGRKPSEETLAKRSAALKGKKWSQARRAAQGA